MNNYYNGTDTTCPICGGKIKHPYTGSMTEEQYAEDWDTCLWVKVVDESKGTIGYTPPICKKDWKKYSEIKRLVYE